MTPSKRKRPETAGSVTSRRKTPWAAIGLWAGLLLLVFIVIMDVLPIGKGISPRGIFRFKRQMDIGKKMEADKLWYAAADIYEKLAEDSGVSGKSRAQAAEKLADLYTGQIPDTEKAIHALEKAVFFEKKETKRADLSARLEKLRSENKQAAPPEGSMVLATVGDAEVTLQEIIQAWKRANPKESPSSEQLVKFTQDFMTTALLAEEARRRKLDRSPEYSMDRRIFEIQSLARTLLASIAPASDPEAIRFYYEKHRDDYRKTDAVNLQHIVTLKADEANAVGERLSKGEDFAAVAREVSLDRDKLTSGCDLGWTATADDFIASAGMVPGLAARIIRHDVGYTTGPLPSARGHHWFRLADKRAGEFEPLERVREKVEKSWRKEAYEATRDQLIAELKKKIPVTIHDDTLKQAVAQLKSESSSRSAPTTPTLDSHGHAHEE